MFSQAAASSEATGSYNSNWSLSSGKGVNSGNVSSIVLDGVPAGGAISFKSGFDYGNTSGRGDISFFSYGNYKAKIENAVGGGDFSFVETQFGAISNTKFGIGTENPQSSLHIDNLGTGDGIRLGEKFKIRQSNNSNNHIVLENFSVDGNLFIRSRISGTTGNLFLNDLGGNVGIGTTSPSQKLEVFNSNAFNSNAEAQAQDHITLSSNDPGNGKYFGGITWTSRTGDVNRRRASIVATRERTDADFVGLAFFTKGTDGSGPMYESMRLTHGGSLGIGTTTTGIHKLAVEGSIGAREIKVQASGWSDFVFENNYNLPTLKEVESHISENGHLKDIPSAKEVEKDGFFLGQMDAKLLQKIEELTLYTIQQEKKIEKMETQLNELKSLILNLKK